MRILVVRTGNSIDLSGETESNYGGTQDAIGVCLALAGRGHDVGIAGSIRSGCLQGIDAIGWRVAAGCNDVAKMSESNKDRVEAECNEFVDHVTSWKPDVVLTSIGAVPSRVNVRGEVNTLIFAVKYCLPEMWLRRARPQWPRICMTNDPRSVPQEWETANWENCLPAAFLSQRDLDWTKRIHGQHFRVVEQHAGLENLFSYGRPVRGPNPDAPWDVTCLAHGHFKDHRVRPKSRDVVWRWILSRLVEGDHDLRWKVVGRHWEHFPWYDQEYMRGPCDLLEVPQVLNESVCGPIIPVLHGYTTAKLRQYAMNGCVPLLYGKNEETLLAYDVDQRYAQFGAWPRFADADELVEKARELKRSSLLRSRYTKELEQATRPDISFVEQCCKHFADGGQRDLNKWGGYEPVVRAGRD